MPASDPPPRDSRKPKNGPAAPPAPEPPLAWKPPGLKLTSVPPTPAIFVGADASFGIAGMSGSATFDSPSS
ncbi:MAG TPA: hypothetical protein VK993_15720 [Chthoniobacterales bacterium]|nr:hypothetical protein [Chthoniobacterales bacterium]